MDEYFLELNYINNINHIVTDVLHSYKEKTNRKKARFTELIKNNTKY